MWVCANGDGDSRFGVDVDDLVGRRSACLFTPSVARSVDPRTETTHSLALALAVPLIGSRALITALLVRFGFPPSSLLEPFTVYGLRFAALSTQDPDLHPGCWTRPSSRSGCSRTAHGTSTVRVPRRLGESLALESTATFTGTFTDSNTSHLISAQLRFEWAVISPHVDVRASNESWPRSCRVVDR